MLKAGEMFEIDKITDEVKQAPIAKHFASWIQDNMDMDAGSIGGKIQG